MPLLDKRTKKLLSHYSKLTHIDKKYVFLAYEHLDEKKVDVYLFGVRASIKMMETLHRNPEKVGDRLSFISDFIKKERLRGVNLPEFDVITKADMARKPPKPQKFEVETIAGEAEYEIPKNWGVITKIVVGGKRVDFTVKQAKRKEVMVLDKTPDKVTKMRAWVIMKT